MQDVKKPKKYRIMSVEAEKLAHAQLAGGFSPHVDGTHNLKLFSGILDYSLESEKLLEVYHNSRSIPRKTYFSNHGYDYTTAIINVKFNFSRHDFVNINGIFEREGHRVSDKFSNCSEVRTDENGNQFLVAVTVCLCKKFLDMFFCDHDFRYYL